MAKYYLQEMPDISKKGKRKVYPKMQVYRQIEMGELVEHIQKRSGIYKTGIVNGILTTLAGYCRINRMSRSSASRELIALCKDSQSGITSSGTAPHKTWVRRKAQE